MTQFFTYLAVLHIHMHMCIVSHSIVFSVSLAQSDSSSHITQFSTYMFLTYIYICMYIDCSSSHITQFFTYHTVLHISHSSSHATQFLTYMYICMYIDCSSSHITQLFTYHTALHISHSSSHAYIHVPYIGKFSH